MKISTQQNLNVATQILKKGGAADFSFIRNGAKTKINEIISKTELSESEKTRQIFDCLSSSNDNYVDTSSGFFKLILKSLITPDQSFYKLDNTGLEQLEEVKRAFDSAGNIINNRYTLTFKTTGDCSKFYDKITGQYSQDRDDKVLGSDKINKEGNAITLDLTDVGISQLADRLSSSLSAEKDLKRKLDANINKTSNTFFGLALNTLTLWTPIVPVICYGIGSALAEVHSYQIPFLSEFSSVPARFCLECAKIGAENGNWFTVKNGEDLTLLGKMAKSCQDKVNDIDARERARSAEPISWYNFLNKFPATVRDVTCGFAGAILNSGKIGLDFGGKGCQYLADKAFDEAEKRGILVKTTLNAVGASLSTVGKVLNTSARVCGLAGSAFSGDCSARDTSENGVLNKFRKFVSFMNKPSTSYNCGAGYFYKESKEDLFVKNLHIDVDTKPSASPSPTAAGTAIDDEAKKANDLKEIKCLAKNIFLNTKSAEFEHSGISGDSRQYFKVAKLNYDGEKTHILYCPLDDSIAIVSKFKEHNSHLEINSWNKFSSSKAPNIIEALKDHEKNNNKEIKVTQSNSENGISFMEFKEKLKKTGDIECNVTYSFGTHLHISHKKDSPEIEITRIATSTKLNELECYKVVNRALVTSEKKSSIGEALRNMAEKSYFAKTNQLGM